MKVSLDAKTGKIISQAASECVLFRLRRLDRKMTQSFNRSLKPAGLRATQFAILTALSMFSPMNQQDFSEMMMMDQSTLSRNIKILTKLGLVSCEPGEDRRSREISLTREGAEKLAEAAPKWKEAHESLKGNLTEKQWNALMDCFNALAAAID